MRRQAISARLSGDDERVGADSQSLPDRGRLAGIYIRAERTATGTGSPSTADGRNAILTLVTSNNPTRHVACVNALLAAVGSHLIT